MTRTWCMDVTAEELSAATPHVLIDRVAMTADVDGVVYQFATVVEPIDSLVVIRDGIGVGLVGGRNVLPDHYTAFEPSDVGKIGTAMWATPVALAWLANRCAAVAPVLAAQRDKVLAVVVAHDATYVFLSDTSAARIEGYCRRHACHIVGPDGPYVPTEPPYSFPVLDPWENALGLRGVRSYVRVEGNDGQPCVDDDHDPPIDLTECPRCMRMHGSTVDAQACPCIDPTRQHGDAL